MDSMVVGMICAVVVARVLFAYALMNAAERHARYSMRVRLARWLMDGRLTDVKATKRRGKIGARK